MSTVLENLGAASAGGRRTRARIAPKQIPSWLISLGTVAGLATVWFVTTAAGLKVAMALSWAVVVAAKLVGAQSGLGFMISDAAMLFRIPIVFIGIALIGLIGLILNLVLSGFEGKVIHWKGHTAS